MAAVEFARKGTLGISVVRKTIYFTFPSLWKFLINPPGELRASVERICSNKLLKNSRKPQIELRKILLKFMIAFATCNS